MLLPKKEFIGLYVAYVISCLGDRIWSFCIIFLLAHLGSLRLVTMNQLFQGLAQMLLASFVGKWYDRSGRWLGIQSCLLFNNLSVAISAGLLIISLSDVYNVYYLLSIAGSILFCSIALASASGEKTAFSKDWVVVMSSSLYKNEEVNINSNVDGDVLFTKILSKQNALLTIIDQSSSILSPIIGGLILDHSGYKWTCYIMIIWNFIGWVFEAITLNWVYNRVPELSIKSQDNNEIEPVNQNQKVSIIDAFISFCKHQVFPVALGLGFLYATILAFDGISISYGKEQGMNSTLLGVFQAIGSILGMLGAITFPYLTKRFGLSKTSLIGVTAELISLFICVLSVFLPGSPFNLSGYFSSLTLKDWWNTFLQTFKSDSEYPSRVNTTGVNWNDFTIDGSSASSTFALYCGIALARYGLWLADLSITQLMQESVKESMRGTIFGVETAICQFFSVTKDVLAILLPDERTFGLLIFISVGSVVTTFILTLYFNLKVKFKSKYP